MAAKLRVLVTVASLAFNVSVIAAKAVAEDSGLLPQHFLSKGRPHANQTTRNSRVNQTTRSAHISLHAADSVLTVVQNLFKLWDEGAFGGVDCVQRATPYLHPSVVFHAEAYNMQNTVQFRPYQNIHGFCELVKFFSGFVQKGKAVNMLSDGKGDVMVVLSYMPVLLSTGKSAMHKVVDIQKYSVKDGKIVACKIYWGDPGVMDALFPSDVDAVKLAIGMWARGDFHGPGCPNIARAIVDENMVMDASASMQNSENHYKVYKGIAGWCQWVANCEKFRYDNYKILAMKSMGHGKVFVKSSNKPTLLATQKSVDSNVVDIQEYTVKNGKLSECKVYWGTPSSLDALFVA